MTFKPGTYPIGPDKGNGRLTINTYVGGMGAKMGHDLVLEAKQWEGTLSIDDDVAASSVTVTVEAASLEVVEATGGLKALTDKDRAEIAQNQTKTLQTGKFPHMTFQSTTVAGGPAEFSVEGDLTIAGNTKVITLSVTLQASPDETQATAKTQFKQTDFGVKPYSKLGALKVKDEVDMQIVVTIPSP